MGCTSCKGGGRLGSGGWNEAVEGTRSLRRSQQPRVAGVPVQNRVLAGRALGKGVVNRVVEDLRGVDGMQVRGAPGRTGAVRAGGRLGTWNDAVDGVRVQNRVLRGRGAVGQKKLTEVGVACQAKIDVGPVPCCACGAVRPVRAAKADPWAPGGDRVPEKVPPEVLLDELARGRRRRRGSDCGEREMLRAMAMKAIPDLASSSLSVDLEIHPRWAPTVHFRRKLRALLDSGVSVKDIVDRLLPPCEEVKDGRDWPRPAAKMEGGRRC